MIQALQDRAADLRELLVVLRADHVVMIHAYFDESGTHPGSIVTCVAGYVFETEQLLRFEAEWKSALDEYGIKRFHMSECAHGVGEFKGKSKEDRVELGRRLIGSIKRRARIGIVGSIQESEYKKVANPEMANQGGAYMAALVWCITGVATWVAKNGITERISYFFEAGHRLQSFADKAMQNLSSTETLRTESRYHSHTFIAKDAAFGTQAADLLAWQWHSEWRNRFSVPRRLRRADFDSLLELPHIASHLTADGLLAIGSKVQGAALPDDLRRFDTI